MSDRVSPCTATRDPWLREAVGAYLLGALEPEENDRVAGHLVTCANCRAEYGELTELLPLLASVTEAEAVNGPVRPEPAVLGRVLETASQQVADDAVSRAARPGSPEHVNGAGSEHAKLHRGRRYRPARTSLRTRIALGTAGLLAAVGAGLGLLLGGGAQVAAAPGSWSASATVATTGYEDITASVEVTPVSWGSKIQLKMDNVPVGYTCTMVVVSTSGKSVTAGDWKAGDQESFTIPGSVALSPDHIAIIQVDLPDGSTLLSLSHPR